MNPQETANSISTFFVASLIFLGLTALQAWALIAVLSWFGVGVSLNLLQASVVVLLARGVFG